MSEVFRSALISPASTYAMVNVGQVVTSTSSTTTRNALKRAAAASNSDNVVLQTMMMVNSLIAGGAADANTSLSQFVGLGTADETAPPSAK